MHWRSVLLVGWLALAGCSNAADSAALPAATSTTVTSATSVGTASPSAGSVSVPPSSTSSIGALDSSPNQSAEDAQLDRVVGEVAVLPFVERVDALVEVGAPEGVWTLSRIPQEGIDAAATGGVIGDPDGEYPADLIFASEYGEILLIDEPGHIARAYPMPGAVPSWIVITEQAVFAGRIGDGGLPDSALVRIDRETFAAEILLIPAPFDGGTQWPAGWAVATPDQARIYEDSVGFAPAGAQGIRAHSWLGEVVVDIDDLRSLIDGVEITPGSAVDRFSDCPNRPPGSSPAVFDNTTGTYAAIIESIDTDSLVVTFDVVQWLSGQDATDAYHQQHPDDSNGPPNDYWIRNDNPTLRDAPVAADADVLLVRLSTDSSADVSAGTLTELPAYFTQTPLPFTLYWLTFDAETIVGICEQYTP